MAAMRGRWATNVQGGARWLAFVLAAVVVALLLEGETPQNEARARGLTVVGSAAVLAAALVPRRSGGRLELALLLGAWAACALAVFGGSPWPWRGPHDALVAWSIGAALPAFVGAVLCRFHTAPHGRATRLLLWINALMLPGTVIAALFSLGVLAGFGSSDSISIRSQMPGRVWITPIGGRHDHPSRLLLPTVWSVHFTWPCVRQRALPLDRGDCIAIAFEADDCDCTEIAVADMAGQILMVRVRDTSGTMILSPASCEPLSAAVSDALRPGQAQRPSVTLAANAAILVHVGSLLLLLLRGWRRAP